MKIINIRNAFGILIICLLFTSTHANAQRYQRPGDDTYSDQPTNNNRTRNKADSLRKKDFLSRLVYGGNFSLAFGDPTYIDLSPLIGYRLTKELTAGVGVTYMYIHENIYYLNPQSGATEYYPATWSMYGARVYGEYAVTRSLFLHGEYEALDVPTTDPYTGLENGRIWIGDPLIGIGYKSRIGMRSYFMISALYNLNYANNQQYSPYTSPLLFRVGFVL